MQIPPPILKKSLIPDADGDLVVAHGVSVDEGVELQLLLVVEDHLKEFPVRIAWVSVSQNLSWSENYKHDQSWY